jgi:hypothetical protein
MALEISKLIKTKEKIMKGEDYQRFLTHAIEADSNDKDLNKYLDEKIYDLYDLLNLLFEVNILENMN